MRWDWSDNGSTEGIARPVPDTKRIGNESNTHGTTALFEYLCCCRNVTRASEICKMLSALPSSPYYLILQSDWIVNVLAVLDTRYVVHFSALFLSIES